MAYLRSSIGRVTTSLPGAPSLTAEASGSIVGGKGVVINSNGTVSSILGESPVAFTVNCSLASSTTVTVPGGSSAGYFYSLTSGSTNAASPSDNTGNVLVGMVVSGTGVPAGTTVAAIVNGFNFTLSAAATASGAPTLTFTGAPNTGSLAAGMAVSGHGIPSGTTIASITNATSFVTSAAATITTPESAFNMYTSVSSGSTTLTVADTSTLSVGIVISNLSGLPAGAYIVSITNSTTFVVSAAGTMNNNWPDTTYTPQAAISLSFLSSAPPTSNLTMENFIGFCDHAVSSGRKASITSPGYVTTTQSSLTPGQQYYVQYDGTLALSSDTTMSGNTLLVGKVLAGTALTATSLLVEASDPDPAVKSISSSFTALGGETTVDIEYVPGQLSVYLNGIKLLDTTDYTGTTGTSIVLASALALDDVVDFVALSVFSVGDHVPASTGGTFIGEVTLPSPVINTGVSGSAILDSDAMSGVSATKLSSSESIKAYVDAQSHTAEGTAVLSTGETGGTKFLREDGDGTSSWQAAGHPSIVDGGNATAITIDSSENVGIGTTTPGNPLEIQSTAASYTPVLEIANLNTGAYAGMIKFTSKHSSTEYNPANIRAYGGSGSTDGSLAFETMGTERMRITSSGDIGIGTTPTTNSLLHAKFATSNYFIVEYPAGGYSGWQFNNGTASEGYLDYGTYGGFEGFRFYAGGGGGSDIVFTLKDDHTANFYGHVLPAVDNSTDLGSASYRWRNIYTTDLHLQNERGDWTVIEEEEYLSLRNNKTDKIYKIVMEEIE